MQVHLDVEDGRQTGQTFAHVIERWRFVDGERILHRCEIGVHCHLNIETRRPKGRTNIARIVRRIGAQSCVTSPLCVPQSRRSQHQ